MKPKLQGASYLFAAFLFATGLMLGGCGTATETTESGQAPPDSVTAALQADNQRLQADNAQLKKTNAQLDQDKKALSAKVADLTSKLGQSSQQWQDFQDLQVRVNTLDSELTVEKQINRDLSAKNADYQKATPAPAVASNAEFKQKYDEALKLFKTRKYKEAVANLQDLAGSSVSDDLVSNAHYWLGECYYALKQYEDAVKEFQKTLTYAKTFKAGPAYLMLGMSYVRLGDKENARTAWQTLAKKYPKSQEAKRGNDFLKQL